MDVLAGRDAGLGVVEQVADARLDQDRLQAGRLQELIAGQPLEPAVGGRVSARFRSPASGSTTPTTS